MYERIKYVMIHVIGLVGGSAYPAAPLTNNAMSKDEKINVS